jgi:very-short-patch-repair endonuclease
MVTRYRLAKDFQRLHRNVYAPGGVALNAAQKAYAAWLWSGRRATLVGMSAAAVHGMRWIDARLPAEVNQRSQHKKAGVVLHSDTLAADEVTTALGLPVTGPARTAFDLGRRRGLTSAVIRVDALMRATGPKVADVEPLLTRHRGARGVIQLGQVLQLADGGSESPQESRLRLLLRRLPLGPPRTQFEVYDKWEYFVARIDLAWPEWRVGVEYDGVQHWTDGAQRSRDIDRLAELEALGWRIIRVSAELLRDRPRTVVMRARSALEAAGAPL